MASRAVSRVFVASGVRDLAKQVRQLTSIKVEDLHYTRNTETGADVQPGDGAELLQEVEVLLCDGSALIKWLKTGAIPNLKWAHFTWAGVDDLMKELNHQRPKQDFLLTRSGEAYTDIMGEYVIGQIIARERHFATMKEAQEMKEYRHDQFRIFRPLNTLSIGILGYGTIGKRVAEMCKFFGMTVWAVNRTQQSPSPHVDHFRGVESLTDVLQNVDYLCSILPNTPASCDLLSGEVLRHCQQKKTVLINIGRGNVISDESLVQAIREGWLGGAILDVFNQEPLPADSPLWTLPNVFITPHVSGPALSEPLSQSFVKNLECYMAGQPLHNTVDWGTGY